MPRTNLQLTRTSETPRMEASGPAFAGPSEPARRGPPARVPARWAARGEARGASRSDADPCPAGAGPGAPGRGCFRLERARTERLRSGRGGVRGRDVPTREVRAHQGLQKDRLKFLLDLRPRHRILRAETTP